MTTTDTATAEESTVPQNRKDLYEVGERDTGSCGLLQLVAFTVSEADHGATDLNGDGDALDNVLHVLDLLTGVTKSTGRSAVPCTFAECDPRCSRQTR